MYNICSLKIYNLQQLDYLVVKQVDVCLFWWWDGSQNKRGTMPSDFSEWTTNDQQYFLYLHRMINPRLGLIECYNEVVSIGSDPSSGLALLRCVCSDTSESSQEGQERPRLSSCLNIQSVNLRSYLVCSFLDIVRSWSKILEKVLVTVNQPTVLDKAKNTSKALAFLPVTISICGHINALWLPTF